MRLLAGDIGGTKTALSLCEHTREGRYVTLRAATYPSAAHASLDQLLAAFLGAEPVGIAAAAFGVAGPVQAGRCETTNLPWVVSAAELANRLGAKVTLINDFHATTLGIRELDAGAFCVLQDAPVDASGPFAVLGAGTGLGEAIGVPMRDGVCVLASEGGHADFAARSEVEQRLVRFLWSRYGGHVSVERVVSGLGLGDLYDFVVHDGIAPADAVTRERFERESRAKVIGERGLGADDPAAREALRLFVSAYGAEAGNLALRVLPTGGLYVAGGIAAKILPLLQDGAFMASFLAKGRMSKILGSFRVSVVLAPEVGLLGARACAALSLNAG